MPRREHSRFDESFDDASGGGPGRGKIDIMAAAVEIGVMVLGVALSGWILAKMIDPHKEEKRKGQEQMRKLKKMFRNEKIELNQYEMMIVSELVNPEKLDIALDDVGGLKSEKQRLRSLIVEPLRNPPVFRRSTLLSMPRGVLLYGPPGTGKTMMAKALAKDSGAWFINAKTSLLLNKYYGESQKLVNALFTLAQKLSPCVIFVDEVDSLLGRRNEMDQEHNTQLKTEFMQMWDGFSQTDHFDVVVLGATNRPWALDDAILRRFSVQVEVPMPGPRDRAKILHTILSAEKTRNPEVVSDELVRPSFGLADPQPSEALVEIAKKADGFSGSQLKDLCQEAARLWMSEYSQRTQQARADEVAASASTGTSSRRASRMNSRTMMERPVVGMTSAHFDQVLATNRVRKGTEEAEMYRVKSNLGRAGPGGESPASKQAEIIQNIVTMMMMAIDNGSA